MTFSPELEAKFAKMIGNYPPGRQKGALIPMLLYAQDEVGAVTEEVIDEVARRLQLSRVEVEEVLGYYTMLAREPRGKYHIQICTNISCMLTGGEELFEHACRRLGIGNKGKTPDGAVLARRGRVPRGLLLGAGHAGQLRVPLPDDAGEVRPADRKPEEVAVKQCRNPLPRRHR